jgi:hypothetical protein
MPRHNFLRPLPAILLAALVLPVTARAQSQDSQSQSVADAARRAREQKKAAAKPTPVVTDDTLKRAPAAAAPAPSSDAASAPAPEAPSAPQNPPDSPNPPSADNAPAGSSAPAATPEDAKQKAKDSTELAALKQQLAEAEKGLDLLQREFALQQDTYNSNPGRDKDTAGKSNLDEMKQLILDKQQEVEALKTRVAALQDSLGNSAPPPPPTPPPTPQS